MKGFIAGTLTFMLLSGTASAVSEPGVTLRQGAIACHSEKSLDNQVRELISEPDPRLVENCLLVEYPVQVEIQDSPGSAIAVRELATGWQLFTMPQYLEVEGP